MARDEHILFIENIPAYTIGALDPDEVSVLEAHLQTCESCRTELAAYRAVSDSLLMALPPQQPSEALRRRLQSRLPGAYNRPRPRLAWSFNQLALGTALVFLLVLNLISLTRLQALQNQQAELSDQVRNGQVALAMLSYPGVQTLPITGENVTGTILLDQERNSAVLIVRDLPSLSEDQVYQAWLIDPQGGRVSAGLFRPEADQPFTTEAVFSNQDLSMFVGLGVTVEPAGGSDQPTGTRVFKVDF